MARATFVSVALIGFFYALSAWAMIVTVGPADIGSVAAQEGPGLVFGGLAEYWGPAREPIPPTYCS